MKCTHRLTRRLHEGTTHLLHMFNINFFFLGGGGAVISCRWGGPCGRQTEVWGGRIREGSSIRRCSSGHFCPLIKHLGRWGFVSFCRVLSGQNQTVAEQPPPVSSTKTPLQPNTNLARFMSQHQFAPVAFSHHHANATVCPYDERFELTLALALNRNYVNGSILKSLCHFTLSSHRLLAGQISELLDKIGKMRGNLAWLRFGASAPPAALACT